MKTTKTITMTAMMIAIGLVLPSFFRMIPNGGVLFSPMHIVPLLTGLLIGPLEGIIVGVLCPILNNVLFGMPAGSTLLGMIFELPAYGLVTGLMMMLLAKQKDTVKVYVSLIVAMIAGRIVGGIVKVAIVGLANYSLSMWVSAYFVATAPAIIIHLVLLPIIYIALKKAGFARS